MIIEYRVENGGDGSANVKFYNIIGLAQWLEDNYDSDSWGESSVGSFECNDFKGNLNHPESLILEIAELEDKKLLQEFKEKFLPNIPTITESGKKNYIFVNNKEIWAYEPIEDLQIKFNKLYKVKL